MAEMSATQPAMFAWPNRSGGPAVSVIAPMHDEAGGAAVLIGEIAAAFSGREVEIIIVDDGSGDATADIVDGLRGAMTGLRLIRHGKNAGQSRALRTGVLAARANVVAMLDGDGQNDPAELPAMVDQLLAGAKPLALVAGERRGRKDAASKRFASRIANAFRRWMLKDGAADTGCGLKVFYREAFLRLPYFDHMHRYLPALMRREGFAVEYRPVAHRARAHGRSKYTNLGRLGAAIGDLRGVLWLLGRARDPESVTESGEE